MIAAAAERGVRPGEIMEDRLQALRMKEELTDEEMRELVRLSKPETFKTGPNLLTLGVTDVDIFFKNFKEGEFRAKKAREAGCYMEVISLRLQHMELWLRMFWVVRNKGARIFDPDDKRSFGTILKDCKALGLDGALVVRMERFNQSRIDAIHKYLLGATDYEGMQAECGEHQGLDAAVRDWILKEIGIPWTA